MVDLPQSTWTVKRRILLVEDHPFTRMGIAAFIDRQPDLEVCGQAGNTLEAQSLVEQARPDLVITDLSLPGRSGLDLIKDLHALHPEIPVLVLSMHDEPVYAERVLRAGGRGFMTKGDSANLLLNAIRNVLRGKIYLSEEMSAYVLEHFTGRLTPQGQSPLERLSDREFDIFGQIGQARSSRQIACDLGIGIKTVETHIGNIKQKFGVGTLRELSRLATCWLEEQRQAQVHTTEQMPLSSPGKATP